MAASYKKLFKLLIDREMKSKDLAQKAGKKSPKTWNIKKKWTLRRMSIWKRKKILIEAQTRFQFGIFGFKSNFSVSKSQFGEIIPD